MKLKRYNDFIKESFATSKEYMDFVTSKAISTDIFDDSLFDVKQFARVNNYRWVEDSKGHIVNTEVSDNEKYRMIYTCIIQYTIKEGRNDFNKIIDNLNTIKISIDEMIDRATEAGLKLKQNVYESSSMGHKFEISFIGDDVDLEELKSVYNDYTSFQDKEYLSGLKRLREIYRSNNIDFDRFMDTVDDEDYIQVGVFIDEELYVVASYNIETKQFSIYNDEIEASVEAYRDSQ